MPGCCLKNIIYTTLTRELHGAKCEEFFFDELVALLEIAHDGNTFDIVNVVIDMAYSSPLPHSPAPQYPNTTKHNTRNISFLYMRVDSG